MIQEKKHRKKNKKPSAMAQVHNRVNAGIMDAVTCGGMMEAAEPEDNEYKLGGEMNAPIGGVYYHTMNESSDVVPYLDLTLKDEKAIPFVTYVKPDGEETELFVGNPGEEHFEILTRAVREKKITKEEFGSLWDVKRNEYRSGRVWFTDKGVVASFYSYRKDNYKRMYRDIYDSLLMVSVKTGTEINIGKVMLDFWTFNSQDVVIIPVRWLNNGTADVYFPYMTKCTPAGDDTYNLRTTKGTFVLDWKGDDIEAEYGMLREGKEFSKTDYQKYIKSIIDFLREQHLNIDPLPKITLNNEEQDGLFIKTGYYLPDEKEVVVFTRDRHIKDCLRSFVHEMVHHMQNLQNPNKDWGGGGDLEKDGKLRGIEGEAFLLGNILFREWTEKMKKTKGLNESTQRGTNLDEFWNGDGDEMDFIYPEDVPDKLYHVSPTKNRESILRNGLMPSVGDEYFDWWSYESPNGDYEDLCDMPELVFLTDNPNTWLECLGGSDYDLYEIDTKQLDKEDISLDPTPSLAKRGCYCYGGIISPRAIKLIKTIEPEQYTALNESRKQRKNDKGEIVPETCDKCGGKVVCQIHGEPVYVCKECGKYFGTMPFNLNENVDAEIVEPDDVDLSSFNIKKHLNPKFWDGEHLDTRIRLKLLDIADDFYSSLGVDWVDVEDVIMTGSLANYNWDKKHSDIDLHILIDYKDVDERVDFVREYFTLKKNEWNEKHKGLKIFGFPVEVYVQDTNEEHASSGVYSVDRDEWITEPDLGKLRSGKVDKRHVREMVSTYMNKIDCLIDIYKHHKDDKHEMEKVARDAEEMFGEIKKMRKDDLAKYSREMCDGNIIFKALRRSDYIGKLIKLKNLTYDKINSI